MTVLPYVAVGLLCLAAVLVFLGSRWAGYGRMKLGLVSMLAGLACAAVGAAGNGEIALAVFLGLMGGCVGSLLTAALLTQGRNDELRFRREQEEQEYRRKLEEFDRVIEDHRSRMGDRFGPRRGPLR